MKNKPWDTQYKIGDKIRCVKLNASSFVSKGTTLGKTYLIHEVNKGGGVYRDDVGAEVNTWWNEFEKIEDEPRIHYQTGDIISFESSPMFPPVYEFKPFPPLNFHSYYSTNEPKAQKKPTLMNSIVKTLKDLKLSKEDRALRESDFEDENGKPTSIALDMMEEEILMERWDSRRKEIAKDLLTLKKDA